MFRATAPDGAGLNGGVMNEPMMTVSGNLVSDVDMRQTARGDALARFRVASTVKRYDRATGQWVDGDTAYWNVTAWRRAAENAAQSLAKGHPVVVHGRVRQRTVDREVAGAPGVSMPRSSSQPNGLRASLRLAGVDTDARSSLARVFFRRSAAILA